MQKSWIEDIHTCEKSKGKIVEIAVDMLGNEYCGYCHKRVNYKKHFDKIIKDMNLSVKYKMIKDAERRNL